MNEERLPASSDGFAAFLRDKDLALPRRPSHLARRVWSYFLCSRSLEGMTGDFTG